MSITRQYHFYLNPGKITDDFLIKELKEEKNLSGLVKGLLWVYYKEVKPFGDKTIESVLTKQTNESEV